MLCVVLSSPKGVPLLSPVAMSVYLSSDEADCQLNEFINENY